MLTDSEIAAELLRRREARSSLIKFIQYTKPDYAAGRVHEIMCHALEQWARGEIRNLILELPPRHGKSEIGSRRLPAFMFGINPNLQVISCSYGADLASRMNRDVQRVMDSKEYTNLFPDSSLNADNVRTKSGSYLRNNDIFEVVGHKGVYRSAGVGGSITGMGFHRGIIDDPIKNAEEASSPVYREKLWEWYTSTFLTRAEKDAGILVIMTRWHEDDLVGRLLAREPENWVRLKLPALCEDPGAPYEFRKEGEALWPDKFDEQAIEKIAKSLGSYQFGALYQQNPRPREGNRIKRNWLKSDSNRPVKIGPAVAQRVRYWDLASSESPDADRTAGALLAFDTSGGDTDKHVFIEDCVSGRYSLGERLEIIRATVIADNLKYPGIRTYIEQPPGEAYAVVGAIIRELAGYSVQGDPPKGKKEFRVEALATYMERGFVHLVEGSWNEEFIEEATVFPHGKHDDRIDSAASGFNIVSLPVYQPTYGVY